MPGTGVIVKSSRLKADGWQQAKPLDVVTQPQAPSKSRDSGCMMSRRVAGVGCRSSEHRSARPWTHLSVPSRLQQTAQRIPVSMQRTQEGRWRGHLRP